MLKEKNILVIIGAILFLSSCSFPHWTVPQRHVNVDATIGNAPEVVQVAEFKLSKSHFHIEEFFRSKTLNISEKSFSVLYQGKQIQPKVWAVVSNKYRRLKDLTTIPPMTSIDIHFKIKRNLGDTIVVVEHDIPQTNDSVVIKVEIPEEYEKEDSIDRYNFLQLIQLQQSYDTYDLTKKNCLYHNLKFENGICVKDFVVNDINVYENILHGDMTENMNLIITESEVPQKVLSFTYQYNNRYHISISNDCDLSFLKDKNKSYSDNYKIKVKFFENVKQPYQYKYPFAIVESISIE